MTRPLSRLALVSAAALTLAGAVTATPAGATPTPSPTDQLVDQGNTRFIVKMKGDQDPVEQDQRARTSAASTAAQKGRGVAETRRLATGAHLVKLDHGLSRTEAADWMTAMKNRGDVEYVEVDQLMKPVAVPNDPDWGKQWHYHESVGGLNLPAARDLATGRGVTVAVIDTGITPHSEFTGRVLPGYDFISDASTARDGSGRDANPNDEGDWTETNDPDCADPDGRFLPSSWHGTHVAGTILAATNNGSGVAGVAGDAKLLPVRVLGRCGGYTSDIVDGMAWASGAPVTGVSANPNPAKVINMSLGGRGTCSSAYQNAVNLVTGRGSVLVVAAGNSNKDVSGFTPANCSGVISVASTDREGDRSYFSNYGSSIDVSAPGGDLRSGSANGIWSTVNTGQRTQSSQGYTMMQGTSMAAPHVAGVAALMAQVKPGITQAESPLTNTTRPLPGTCSGGCGTGIVDAAAAVRAAGGGSSTPTPGPTPSPTPTPTPSPAPGGELIRNGGFESGAASWSGDTGTIGTENYPAASGTHKAHLVGDGRTSTEKIEQTVTIPSGLSKAKLDFKLRVDSAEYGTHAYDKLKVELLSSTGQVLATVATFSNADESTGYVQRSYTLSGLTAGELIVRFTGTEDVSSQTSFLIDDVSLVKVA